MKHPTLLLTAALLVACGGADAPSDAATDTAQEVFDFQPEANRLDEVPPIDTVPAPESFGEGVEIAMDGEVTISVTRLMEERDPNNCLMMMSVDNGTDDTVTAGLFAFDVAGGGETTSANMFPQTAAPGERATAQVILPGRTCDVAETITGGQANCTVEGGGSCMEALEFANAEVDFDLDD